MIHLLNEIGTTIKSFDNCSDLVTYINKKELSRLNFLNALKQTLLIPYALEQTRWRFSYYKHSFLKTIYSSMRDPHITEIEQQAFQQELDLIEIHQNSADDPLQVPVEHDTDIKALRKGFSLAYCKAQNYTFSEISDFGDTVRLAKDDGSSP